MVSDQAYNEPVKNRVRKKILSHAVEALTTQRSESTIVSAGTTRRLVAYAERMIRQHRVVDADSLDQLPRELSEWESVHAQLVPSKTPEELRVLYLCGPSPQLDLEVLMDHGVQPHNVIAVESNRSTHDRAMAQVERLRVPLRIHRGPLNELLETVSDTFDIMYLDGCGPLLSKSQNALDPLLCVLMNDRLAPLSCMITNFAEVPENHIKRYSEIMACFFRYRYNDLPRVFWESGLDPAVCEYEIGTLPLVIEEDIGEYYSAFVTRFITDLARFWIPGSKAIAAPTISKAWLDKPGVVKGVVKQAKHVPQRPGSIEAFARELGDTCLSPASYPLLSFFRALNRWNCDDSFATKLGALQFRGKPSGQLLEVVSLLNAVLEGHWSMLSGDMHEAFKHRWFDHGCSFGCDAPLPNLLVNSLLGTYGRPLFANARRSLRLSYRAKKTEMYVDALVFDQCRSFFDWFPNVHGVASRFQSIGFQVIARCIMDQIGRADARSDAHPFRGSAVLGYEASDVGYADRQTLA